MKTEYNAFTIHLQQKAFHFKFQNQLKDFELGSVFPLQQLVLTHMFPQPTFT